MGESPDRSRRYVLAGVVGLLGILTAAILLEVLGTILFALTVAYVLVPVQRWLVRRGLSEWIGALAATLLGFVSIVAVFSPILLTLYFRLDEVIGIVEELPAEIPITAFDVTYTVEVADVQRSAIDLLTDAAFSLASALPVLAIKFALFVILLFALVLKGDAAARAAVAPIPHEYRDIAYALGTRARETLYAIYVLQLATSVATFIIGYPLFWALGYDMALTLALIAAILQFVPIIGPSLLVVPIALYHVAAGELLAAVLVGVLGVALVAWFPDIAVRPRLARRSANLPGSLYFVGFTGGLFTLGPIGIVVGPLIVAVFVEAIDLLADEVNGDVDIASLLEADDERDLDATTDGDHSPTDVDSDTETTFEESGSRTAND
ncbi:AI-2E family transporter [Natrarchaeobius halalkaliphilus]|uniref:AI-2E family transporter n=1 Tax=Natrarchaeobius halalkaliphilus TaxID=1679091 RepID=A0A3N6LTC9_9EURY|nr:AI-2E family transporter [Natrarchaeobius halalkaliphilus]